MEIGPSEAETVLDRLPAQADPPRPARREAGRLRRPRGHQGRRHQGASAPPGSAAASTSCATCWPMPARAAGASSPPSSPPPSPRTTPRPPAPQWRSVADQLRPKVPKLAALMDEAEPDVLAYMTFPTQHRAKLHSHQPARAPQRRDQAPHRGRRHLPQRGRHHPPRRRHPARTERRMGRPARPLHDAGKHRPDRAMIPSSACPPRQPDQPGPAGERRASWRSYTTSVGHAWIVSSSRMI